MNLTVKYGLIAGLGISGWALLEHVLGLHTTRLSAGEYSGYVTSLITFGSLYMLLRQRQQREYNHPLLLGPSLQAGISATLVAALIVYGFHLLYNQLINPGWMDAALEWKVGQWRLQGLNESAIREQILAFRHVHSPRGMLISIGVGMPLTGAILAYGITLFLRRDAKR